MNSIETNEILEMREQLATLKKQLDAQEIINEQLLKEAMSRKLSAIGRRALIQCVVCLFAIPQCFYTFEHLGMSKSFSIGTCVLILFSLIALIYTHIRLHRSDILVGNLVTVYEELTRLRKIYNRWHYWSIPALIAWFTWGGYEIYTYVTQDKEVLISIGMAAVFGCILGGIFGLRMHKSTLRNTDELLHQINGLKS